MPTLREITRFTFGNCPSLVARREARRGLRAAPRALRVIFVQNVLGNPVHNGRLICISYARESSFLRPRGGNPRARV